MKTFSETENDLKQKKVQDCREIVSKIIDFSVDTSQIYLIIELLAMELPDHQKSIELIGCVRELANDGILRLGKE